MITHLAPFVATPDQVAAQDATRKSYTASVELPAGRIAVGIATPIASEEQPATITVGAGSVAFNTLNSNVNNINLAGCTYHESGAIFEVATAGTYTVSVDLSGGTATLFGVIVRAPDPGTGIVEDQGTAEHCGPLAIRHSNGSFYSLHAEMYTGHVYLARDLDGSAVRVFDGEEASATPTNGIYNERYHIGAAMVELSGGQIFAGNVMHNINDIRIRLVDPGTLAIGTQRALAGTKLTYLQMVRLANDTVIMSTRGTAGVNSKAAMVYTVAAADTITASAPATVVDVVAVDDPTWWYPQTLRLIAHPSDGREVVGILYGTRDSGIPNNAWNRVCAAFYDPAGDTWWAVDGTAASQNAAKGTSAVPRFSAAQCAGLTNAGAGIVLANGAAGTQRYTMPAALWQVTTWPTAGSAVAGRVLAWFADSPGDSSAYSFPDWYATFVSADSTALTRTDPAPLEFEHNEPFSFFATVGLGADATGGIASKRDAAGRGWAFWSSGASGLSLNIQNSSTGPVRILVRGPVLSTNTAYHLGFTYDGSGLASGVKLYVDGAEAAFTVANDTLAGSTLANDGYFLLGAIGTIGTTHLSGTMRSAVAYRRALSAADAAELRNGGVARRYADLPAGLQDAAGAWDLEEISDGTAPVARADDSGNLLELTDNGTTAGATAEGATLRAVVQDGLTRTVSPDDFASPPLAVAGSYRFAAAAGQSSATAGTLAITDRGLAPIGADATGDDYGLYWDWGATTIRIFAVDWSTTAAPTFTLSETIDHAADGYTASQVNGIEGEPGEFFYPRAINELHQNHRQALAATTLAATGDISGTLSIYGSGLASSGTVYAVPEPIAYSTAVAADGTYSLTGLPAGTYRIIAEVTVGADVYTTQSRIVTVS